MGIIDKSVQVLDKWLDSKLEKAQASNAEPAEKEPAYERRGLVEIEYGQEAQFGWKERRGLVGPPVLRNMARKDAIVGAIIQTRVNQISRFAQPQKDRYSPGFKIIPKEIADLDQEEKLKLSDPTLDDESKAILQYELEQKRVKLQEKQEEEIESIENFILHCGLEPNGDEDQPDWEVGVDPTKRCDFDKCLKLWVYDRMVYNYISAELVPTLDRSKLHHWYPVSAGTIRYVSRASADLYQKTINEALNSKFKSILRDESQATPEAYKDRTKLQAKPFKYVQVVRGRVEAAWTDQELLFEAGIPTVDPEDNGYGPGELEQLIHIVTAHLFAEAHNRNYFTQGIGSKGILHIKGENLSRGQLEGFKRQWFNQLASSRNSFRPPIIGLADDVKWIELAQSNKDMEFDKWMEYLIKVMCGLYQIDPAEINFDISKAQVSTLNEANNEEKLKSSKDKGLKPILDQVENMINRFILPRWNKDLAARYKFAFVGLDAESREQEQKRLEMETKVWKTLNEARIEMGKEPIANGDLVLNATYTQYLAQKQQAEQAKKQAEMAPGQEIAAQQEDQANEDDEALDQELASLEKQISGEVDDENKAEEKAAKEKEKAEKTEKSFAIEYYKIDDETDES